MGSDSLANPQAGSRNLVEYAANEPATGNVTAISPRAWTVQKSIIPISPKAMIRDAGPPFANAEPLPTNNPVPGSNY